MGICVKYPNRISKIKKSEQSKCSWYNQSESAEYQAFTPKGWELPEFLLCHQKSTGSTGSLRPCLSLTIPGRNTFVLNTEAVREEHHWARGPGLSPPTKAAAAHGATQKMPWAVHCGTSSFSNTGACLCPSHPTFSVGRDWELLSQVMD